MFVDKKQKQIYLNRSYIVSVVVGSAGGSRRWRELHQHRICAIVRITWRRPTWFSSFWTSFQIVNPVLRSAKLPGVFILIICANLCSQMSCVERGGERVGLYCVCVWKRCIPATEQTNKRLRYLGLTNENSKEFVTCCILSTPANVEVEAERTRGEHTHRDEAELCFYFFFYPLLSFRLESDWRFLLCLNMRAIMSCWELRRRGPGRSLPAIGWKPRLFFRNVTCFFVFFFTTEARAV